MKVLKFGGSSLANAERISAVCDIVSARYPDERPVVVLSAMKGVTDLLIAAATEAAAGSDSYRDRLSEIRRRHQSARQELFAERTPSPALEERLDSMFQELSDLLHGVSLVRECTERSLDLIMSFGERLSCTLAGAVLTARGCPAAMFDARELLVTDARHGNARVDFAESYKRIRERLGADSPEPLVPVVTGFIARSAAGVTTTLGRNGSDYTASLFGAALGAEAVEIWTDVDGVMSADPRYVPGAFVVPEISIQEAMELSYFGAEVLHPYTMLPAVDQAIPIRIKNTLRPEAPGTSIIAEAKKDPNHEITGLASIEDVSLINVEGGGMIGMPGVASRIFAALAESQVNVIMISQASSEHSICIVCRREEAARAVVGLKRELAPELASRTIQRFELIEDLEIVAVIGEKMRGKPGISGKLFSALGESNISVLAIAQGSSEMNISFIVEGKQRERVLNVVHGAFFGA